jgi:tetratricopeptide (TPR) repeat protein
MQSTSYLNIALAGALTLAGATATTSHAGGLTSKLPAPQFDDLGDHHHAISTKSAPAQRYFDQGMVLLFGFNHEEAIRSFRAVAELDPDCAMAWWGIGYALGPNINRPMDAAAVPQAWNALQEALRRVDKASPRERAYIDALSKRYRPEVVEDRAELDLAYANAMREVMRAHPDDVDAAALFAEALMDTMPWDYWQPDRRPKPATQEVIGVLRGVLRRDPDHPGANHFFIHAMEAGPTPEDALPSADRLRALELGAAHLVHMPSHIYVRTGQYHDAIEANATAVTLDKSYVAQCKVQGFYPSLYYPHNLHFLWFAHLMTGDGDEAVKNARQIEKLEQDVRCGPSALLEAPRFRHISLITLARFGRWDELAKQKQPSEENPLDVAMWHYAQGLAAAAMGKAESAAQHLARMHRIRETPAFQAVESPIFPATMILDVATMVLEGKVAFARGDTRRGLDALRKAVSMEDEIPYMEPPFWHAPTRQTLGAALLLAGQAADAEGVFRADLDRNPRNGWSLYGLAESLKQQRHTDAAEAVNRAFAQAWRWADGPVQLEWY